jgi:hypothetical protein
MQSDLKYQRSKPKLKKPGDSSKAFDKFSLKNSDIQSQQEFLDSLSDANFQKATNFPTVSDYETFDANNSVLTFPTLDGAERSKKIPSDPKNPKTKTKNKTMRANRSLERSFSNKSLQISGNSIRAFDKFNPIGGDIESQQEFLDSLSDANFNKSINFPTIDFSTLSGKFSGQDTFDANNSLLTFRTLDTPNSTMNSIIQGTPNGPRIKKRSKKSSRKTDGKPAQHSKLTTPTKRTGRDKCQKSNLDLTTMNLEALSKLETNTCLTEKSTNIGLPPAGKRVKYSSSTNKSKEKLLKVQEKKTPKADNKQIQVQAKYKVPELPRRPQVQLEKLESISSIHKNPIETAQVSKSEPTREGISSVTRENKIVKKAKAMLQAKDQQIKKDKEIIDLQKANNEKLQALADSKDVIINENNQKINDFGKKLKEKDRIIQKYKADNAKLTKEGAELHRVLQKLTVSADSGVSMSKSRVSETRTTQNQTTVENTTTMSKTKSGEFSEFRKKLFKSYQKSVQNKNKNKDPEVAKLLKNLKSKSTKQERQQYFDSFVTDLAKRRFGEDQLRKKYVKNLTEHVRKGLKNKDPKFANLKAKIGKMNTSEEKHEYLKKFINHQADRQLAKNNKK